MTIGERIEQACIEINGRAQYSDRSKRDLISLKKRIAIAAERHNLNEDFLYRIIRGD